MSSRAKNYRSIDVICSACLTKLYKYRKGGNGSLVKCIPDRILIDYTQEASDSENPSLSCPKCGQVFARIAQMGGRIVYKIIGGKVSTKGMRRK